MKIIIIIDDDDITPEEKEELMDQIRGLVHNKWWSEFSVMVIGPYDERSTP